MKKGFTIKRVLNRGHLQALPGHTRDLIAEAGELLDDACAHEILGHVVFQDLDGRYYTANVEVVISEITGQDPEELEADADTPDSEDP